MVYKALLKNGCFVPEGTHVFMKEDFLPAYDWLCEQMKLRLPNTPENAKYPIWAWYQWEGIRKRLDMRTSHKAVSPPGTPIVLLTLEVPDDEVLLSDFDMWHSTLGNHYLALTEEEDIAIGDNATAEQKRKSWERIFNLDIDNDYCTYPINQKSIQATFWILKKEYVKKAEFFISK